MNLAVNIILTIIYLGFGFQNAKGIYKDLKKDNYELPLSIFLFFVIFWIALIVCGLVYGVWCKLTGEKIT